MIKSIHALNKDIFRLVRQFRRVLLYGIIGLSALALEVGVFFVLSEQFGMNIWASNAWGMLAGLIFAFSLNAQFNFQVRDRMVERFFRYGLVAFGGYLLTSAIIFGLTHYVDLPVFVAKLISLPPYFLFQYNCHRLFTFHSSETYANVPAASE